MGHKPLDYAQEGELKKMLKGWESKVSDRHTSCVYVMAGEGEGPTERGRGPQRGGRGSIVHFSENHVTRDWRWRCSLVLN